MSNSLPSLLLGVADAVLSGYFASKIVSGKYVDFYIGMAVALGLLSIGAFIHSLADNGSTRDDQNNDRA